jgi:hypothetical protein
MVAFPRLAAESLAFSILRVSFDERSGASLAARRRQRSFLPERKNLRFLRALPTTIVILFAFGFGAWGAMALWYRAPFPPALRMALGALWLAVMLAALVVFIAGRRRQGVGLGAVAIVLLLAWWSTLAPSGERDWAPEVARTVHGEVAGDRLTLTDVRNFEWRSESDFTPRWETRSYDLAKLASVDLIADYWTGEAIAHVFVSFGFSDGQYLAWSVELRKVRGQAWSALAGFFKQSELVALAGDERDLIRLRTNVREEDLRLYRLNVDRDVARKALLAYVEEANKLGAEPRWYNTATTNCTTAVFKIARMVEPGVPLDWRVFISGYFPDYAYDHHALDSAVPFAELRERSKISARAKAADAAPSAEFSKAIRVGVPGVPATP